MHDEAQLNSVALGCGLAMGELIQDESEKRLLLTMRSDPSPQQRVCVARGPAQRAQARVRQHPVPGGAEDMTLSISGDGDDWAMFSRMPADGKPTLIRSRAAVPEVREFAEQNFFSRLRCTLPEDAVTDTGMPKSTDALDQFEDALLGVLNAAGAQTYLVAVTTGHSIRDFFFTAADKAELPAALKSIESERPFALALAAGEAAPFLKALTLSPEEREKATYHQVPAQRSGGGIIGKLFGR